MYKRQHGYFVEVKGNENGLNELVGKVMRIITKVKTSEEFMGGIHTIKFYIAYPTEQVSKDIFNICEHNGIGILRLQITDENKIEIYEVLKPKEMILNGMPNSCQKSPGTFEDAINQINYMKQMFQRPSKLYNDFIRLSIEEYNEKIKLNNQLNRLFNKHSKEALNFLIEKIKYEFPQLELVPGIKFVYKDKMIIALNVGTQNFNIKFGNTSYRINSKNDIIEFTNGTGKKYEGDLESLIKTKIIPSITSSMNISKGERVDCN